MRFLSISTPGSLSITVGTQGELHGFTAQLFEDHPSHLHVRTVKLGPATIVVLKVGELDEILANHRNASNNSNNSNNNNSTTTGSGNAGSGGGGVSGPSSSSAPVNDSVSPGSAGYSSPLSGAGQPHFANTQLSAQQLKHVQQLKNELRQAEEINASSAGIFNKMTDAGATRYDTHVSSQVWKRAVLRTLTQQHRPDLHNISGGGGAPGSAKKPSSRKPKLLSHSSLPSVVSSATDICKDSSRDSKEHHSEENVDNERRDSTARPQEKKRRLYGDAESEGSSSDASYSSLEDYDDDDDIFDEIDDSSKSPRNGDVSGRGNTAQNMFIVVGSDEGYTDVTLLRVAVLLSELCLFLCIEPYGGPNAAVLKQVMMYVEQRLGLQDISFLTEAVEHLVNPAIVATGFSSDPTALLDQLVRQNLFAPHLYLRRQNQPMSVLRGLDNRSVVDDDEMSVTEDIAEERVPGYAAVFFGHKMVLETSKQVADDASRINGLNERFQLTGADRYLIHLITTAHFAMPLPSSYHDIASYEEKRIRVLEFRLRRFGIHRHNITRNASWKLVNSYCSMLRQGAAAELEETSAADVETEKKGASSEEASSPKRAEHERADFYERAFNELMSLMSIFPERMKVFHTADRTHCGCTNAGCQDASCDGRCGSFNAEEDDHELFYTTTGKTYLPSVASHSTVRNQYHDINLRFEELEDSVFTLHNLCFRNADFTGSVQLVWVPTAPPEEFSDDDEDVEDGVTDGTGAGTEREYESSAPKDSARSQALRSKSRSSSVGMDIVTSACPKGYGMVLVYFPPTSDRDADKLPPRMTNEEVVYNHLAQEVLGSMEVNFNSFQWLLSPPVESYETPGLIHFAVIDRTRGNECTSGSVFRMMHQKPVEVQHAVMELRRTFAQCVSRAQEMLSLGYSEGLWGHIGMQFYYSVGMFSDSAASALVSSTAGGQGDASNASSSSSGGNRLPVPSSVVMPVNPIPPSSVLAGVASAKPNSSSSDSKRSSGSGKHASTSSTQAPSNTSSEGGSPKKSSATKRVIDMFGFAGGESPYAGSTSASSSGSPFRPATSNMNSTLTPLGGAFDGRGGLGDGGAQGSAAAAVYRDDNGNNNTSLYGDLDVKKIPSSALPHLVLRPTLLGDTLSDKDMKHHRLVEVYAMFIGSMSPEEICWSVQQLLATKVFL